MSQIAQDPSGALGQSLELRLVDSLLFVSARSRYIPVKRQIHIRRLGSLFSEIAVVVGVSTAEKSRRWNQYEGSGPRILARLFPIDSEISHQHQRESAPTFGMVSSSYC